ncbi:hypothetical protein [Pseudomonas guariconensis]|uniref:hypothetical protein n=1 Tax=Pseudomonas guariconensis TaxID=1288410 RepID=UPI0018D5B69E|nr:hypothetical protein [Pseudomonas guariconensis]MBH3360425.1 hypothetical protein [Pseudomonas guariconensis]
MTTTVYDKAKLLVSCDSRWSIPGDFGVLYVDEAPFQKIEVFRDNVFVFAGMAPGIDAWKKYLRMKAAGMQVARPSLDGIAFCNAKIGCGTVLGYHEQDIILPGQAAMFTGTGSTHAARCWIANGCAKKAVQSAMAYDICSGGVVRHLELSTGEGNLIKCEGIESLNQAFLDKGMVMLNRHDQEKGAIPFKEAAALDPQVAALYGMAANGSLREHVQAPCDAVFNKPTEEDERRVDEMLSKMFD